jgi:hypothetical protein
MTNEKHDPWALLREAREFLGHGLPCATVCGECIVLARIDAALAEPLDSATPVVEWRLGDDCDEGFVYYEAYPDADTGLDVVRFKDGKWRWTMSREQQGYCDTLDEAKSAAIAAARGMK